MDREWVNREWLRFWKRVQITPSGCWLWTGSHNRGYGRFWSLETKRQAMAHRWLYERVHGPIPAGKQLDHRCRVPSCVNPDHLEPVTGLENIRRVYGSYNTDDKRCRRGHPMEGDNVYVSPSGGRTCKECKRVASQKFSDAQNLGPPSADRTHCPRGHPYAGENLRINSQGRRTCVTCARESQRRSIAKRKADPERQAEYTRRDRERQRVYQERTKGRSLGVPNAEKTHCPKGHLYEGDNVYREAGGSRRCRICMRESRQRAYRRRKLRT